jgi:hypothetical protein
MSVHAPLDLRGGPLQWCPECADERPFEMPPCEDGHGADCLDLACLDCGFAIVVGVLVDSGTEAVAELAAA